MTNNDKNSLTPFQKAQGFIKDAKDFFWGEVSDSKYRFAIEKDLKKQIRPAVKFAAGTIAVAIFFFLIWGTLAPLDSAAIAQGSIVLSGNRKTIQHHEGGKIRAIMVKDGDHVKAGQVLIEMDDTSIKADATIAKSNMQSILIMEKRAIAEEKNADSIDFNDPWLDLSDPEVQMLIKNEENLFLSRKKTFEARQAATLADLEAQKEKIIGLQAQMENLKSLVENLSGKVKDNQDLFNQGYISRHELIDKQREEQTVQLQLDGTSAELMATKQNIKKAELSILEVANERLKEAEDEYRKTHAQFLEWQQRYTKAKDALDKTVIRAPADGIVTGLQYHTIGGFIPPGYKVLEIIPQNDELIIEAYVPLQEIASISIGTKAKIQLIPYKQRLVPRISGEVIYISADKQSNERQSPGAPVPEYYIAKVKIDAEELDKINYDVKLYPGMQMTVFLIRGGRTFLQYLMSPITDSFHRAFKEA